MNGKEHVLYLRCYNNDLEQLQDQFVRLAALGVVFITGTHEEVFQLPAKGLLFPIRPHPVTCSCRGKLMVCMVVSMTATVMVILAAAVCGAVASQRAGQAFSFWRRQKRKKKGCLFFSMPV